MPLFLATFAAGSADLHQGLGLSVSVLLVFGSAKLLGEIFERLHISAIVGEILAGIIIGPSLLNWISPNENLAFLAELGVMFLLFRVGLEVDPTQIIKVGKTAVVVGILGVVAPLLAGWGVYRLWGKPHIAALFVGAALTATSVGITAEVLKTKGYLKDISSQIILAAAVIDDVLALLVLGVVSSVAQGSVNFVELGLTSFFAILFVLLVVRWGASLMGGIVSRLDKVLQIKDSGFALALILMFGLAAISEKAGVAPIIGAFLAGMGLSGSLTKKTRDHVHGATELLIPFFLAGIGLHFNLAAFANLPTFTLAILILVVAILSKILACGLGAWSHGPAVATRVGFGMVPRGEFCMVIAQIGLGLNAISASTYGIVVFMAIAATIVTPILLKYAYRNVPLAMEST